MKVLFEPPALFHQSMLSGIDFEQIQPKTPLRLHRQGRAQDQFLIPLKSSKSKFQIQTNAQFPYYEVRIARYNQLLLGGPRSPSQGGFKSSSNGNETVVINLNYAAYCEEVIDGFIDFFRHNTMFVHAVENHFECREWFTFPNFGLDNNKQHLTR